MKKYKLAKDLPFAKAGDDKVRISLTFGEDDFIVRYNDANNTLYTCAIPKNNAHLWIEEVKPRELWIEKHKKIVGIAGSLVELHESKPTPCRECQSEIIHVQEILE